MADLELTRREEFAIITLNRPKALNALSFQLVRDIAAALAWASAALHGLIQASIELGSDELAVIAAQDQITAPSQMFEVERLD